MSLDNFKTRGSLPVTAICLSSGQPQVLYYNYGGSLIVQNTSCDRNKLVNVFPNHNIQGVKVINHFLIIYGEKAVKVYSIMNAEYPTLSVDLQKLDDLVLDCIMYADNYLLIGYAHNFLDIYKKHDSQWMKQRKIHHSNNCMLFSMTISTCITKNKNSTENENMNLIIYSGTAFGQIIVWSVPLVLFHNNTSPDSSNNLILDDQSCTNKNNDVKDNSSSDNAIYVSKSDDSSNNITTLSTMKGHEGVIFRMNLSSDQTTLASVSDDRTVRIWNTTTYELIYTGWGHSARVWDVLFLYTLNDYFITCGEDSTIRLWNIYTGCLSVFSGHDGNIWRICLSSPYYPYIQSNLNSFQPDILTMESSNNIRTIDKDDSIDNRINDFDTTTTTTTNSISHDDKYTLKSTTTNSLHPTHIPPNMTSCMNNIYLYSSGNDGTIKIWNIYEHLIATPYQSSSTLVTVPILQYTDLNTNTSYNNNNNDNKIDVTDDNEDKSTNLTHSSVSLSPYIDINTIHESVSSSTASESTDMIGGTMNISTSTYNINNTSNMPLIKNKMNKNNKSKKDSTTPSSSSSSSATATTTSITTAQVTHNQSTKSRQNGVISIHYHPYENIFIMILYNGQIWLIDGELISYPNEESNNLGSPMNESSNSSSNNNSNNDGSSSNSSSSSSSRSRSSSAKRKGWYYITQLKRSCSISDIRYSIYMSTYIQDLRVRRQHSQTCNEMNSSPIYMESVMKPLCTIICTHTDTYNSYVTVYSTDYKDHHTDSNAEYDGGNVRVSDTPTQHHIYADTSYEQSSSICHNIHFYTHIVTWKSYIYRTINAWFLSDKNILCDELTVFPYVLTAYAKGICRIWHISSTSPNISKIDPLQLVLELNLSKDTVATSCLLLSSNISSILKTSSTTSINLSTHEANNLTQSYYQSEDHKFHTTSNPLKTQNNYIPIYCLVIGDSRGNIIVVDILSNIPTIVQNTKTTDDSVTAVAQSLVMASTENIHSCIHTSNDIIARSLHKNGSSQNNSKITWFIISQYLLYGIHKPDPISVLISYCDSDGTSGFLSAGHDGYLNIFMSSNSIIELNEELSNMVLNMFSETKFKVDPDTDAQSTNTTCIMIQIIIPRFKVIQKMSTLPIKTPMNIYTCKSINDFLPTVHESSGTPLCDTLLADYNQSNGVKMNGDNTMEQNTKNLTHTSSRLPSVPSSLYISGYIGNMFTIYDIIHECILCNVEGGSWKRPHDCTLLFKSSLSMSHLQRNTSSSLPYHAYDKLITPRVLFCSADTSATVPHVPVLTILDSHLLRKLSTHYPSNQTKLLPVNEKTQVYTSHMYKLIQLYHQIYHSTDQDSNTTSNDQTHHSSIRKCSPSHIQYGTSGLGQILYTCHFIDKKHLTPHIYSDLFLHVNTTTAANIEENVSHSLQQSSSYLVVGGEDGKLRLYDSDTCTSHHDNIQSTYNSSALNTNLNEDIPSSSSNSNSNSDDGSYRMSVDYIQEVSMPLRVPIKTITTAFPSYLPYSFENSKYAQFNAYSIHMSESEYYTNHSLFEGDSGIVIAAGGRLIYSIWTIITPHSIDTINQDAHDNNDNSHHLSNIISSLSTFKSSYSHTPLSTSTLPWKTVLQYSISGSIWPKANQDHRILCSACTSYVFPTPTRLDSTTDNSNSDNIHVRAMKRQDSYMIVFGDSRGIISILNYSSISSLPPKQPSTNPSTSVGSSKTSHVAADAGKVDSDSTQINQPDVKVIQEIHTTEEMPLLCSSMIPISTNTSSSINSFSPHISASNHNNLENHMNLCNVNSYTNNDDFLGQSQLCAFGDTSGIVSVYLINPHINQYICILKYIGHTMGANCILLVHINTTSVDKDSKYMNCIRHIEPSTAVTIIDHHQDTTNSDNRLKTQSKHLSSVYMIATGGDDQSISICIFRITYNINILSGNTNISYTCTTTSSTDANIHTDGTDPLSSKKSVNSTKSPVSESKIQVTIVSLHRYLGATGAPLKGIRLWPLHTCTSIINDQEDIKKTQDKINMFPPNTSPFAPYKTTSTNTTRRISTKDDEYIGYNMIYVGNDQRLNHYHIYIPQSFLRMRDRNDSNRLSLSARYSYTVDLYTHEYSYTKLLEHSLKDSLYSKDTPPVSISINTHSNDAVEGCTIDTNIPIFQPHIQWLQSHQYENNKHIQPSFLYHMYQPPSIKKNTQYVIDMHQYYIRNNITSADNIDISDNNKNEDEIIDIKIQFVQGCHISVGDVTSLDMSTQYCNTTQQEHEQVDSNVTTSHSNIVISGQGFQWLQI